MKIAIKTIIAIFILFVLSVGADLYVNHSIFNHHSNAGNGQTETTQAQKTKTISSPLKKDALSKGNARDTSSKNKQKYDNKRQVFSSWGLDGGDLIAIAIAVITFGFTWYGLKQNRISNENQNRAYVHADSAWFGGGEIPSVWITVSNTGATPAKWFEVASCSKTYESNRDVTDEDINFDDVGQFVRWSALAAGTQLKPRLGSVNEMINVVRTMQDDSISFLVYGIIRYETIFDELRETQFAFVKTKPKPSKKKDVVYLVRPPTNLKVFSPV